jgi:1,4-alpha-glucan branching enzyme
MADNRDIVTRLRSRDPNVRDAARAEVARTLAAEGGNVRAAAERLGLSAATVRRWSRWPMGPSAGHATGSDHLQRDAVPAEAEYEEQPAAKGQPEPPVEPGPEAAHRPAITRAELTAPLPVAAAGRPRSLSFVLHTHLPWVLGHGTWPHGEDWLAEAAVHCYLPLVDMLDRLRREGLRNLLTVSITPILAAQLADPRTRSLIDRYLAQRLKAARESLHVSALASWWADRFDGLITIWRRFGRDLVGAFADLAGEGVIELATCAATHAYLPLTHTQELINLELATAVALHERLFGRRPAGAWLPECAYRPGGPWRHPVTGARETARPGVEAFLQRHGIRWTVVDTHLVLGGHPAVSSGGDTATAPDVVEGAVAQPVLIDSSRVAAFVREPRSALQVWSRDYGYPGDPRYLDFHKRHWPSGLRLWRVTHPRADLADKQPYDPRAAGDAVEAQAEHFVELVAHLAGLDDGVAVCPFDTELFGHWWYEGPAWLEAVLRKAAAHPLVTPTSAGAYLEGNPPAARMCLPEGSWGDGGDHRVWVNPDTEWMWYELASSEFAVQTACRHPATTHYKRAVLNQLMILAASDWPFLVTTGAARDYAEERFSEHRRRLQQLLASPPTTERLPLWAREDMAFPFLDPEWWQE